MDSVPKDTNKPFQEYPSKRSTTYDATGEDRISNLPDSVLCHILRFLPTKNAVATAILSKSWKTLFASIHDLVLHFDDSVLLHPEQASDSNMLDRKTSFTSFVYRVLNVILRDAAHIDAFFLSCEQEYDDDHINAWISAALSHNVESLHLNMTMKNADLLLRSLSGCTTLTSLTFYKHLLLDVPGSFCLPNLKELDVEYVEFPSDDSVRRLFTGCPVLEDLGITCCDLRRVSVLDISIPSLKGLTIDTCENHIDQQVILDTPALDIFSYYGCVAAGYPVKNLNTVRLAHIEISLNEEQLIVELEENGLNFYKNVAELVVACSNVDHLWLSKETITMMHFSGRSRTMFHNLAYLQLGGLDIDGWSFLVTLLEMTPNLKFLDITRGFYDEEGSYECFKEWIHGREPVCLSLHLKKIELWEFSGEEDEVKLVEYFLTNAKVLEQIEICSSLSLEKLKVPISIVSWNKFGTITSRKKSSWFSALYVVALIFSTQYASRYHALVFRLLAYA
ncbi:hypothetical protein RJ640_004647 [Escallonia rubra]|uniref:F-box domain-containing protein n=1 Tax=Escallonia rubra TaxID=112253 RepID=A0AA88RCQ9_9ASTE|nr:hypothetical protein RJ640_004647 [Escallonia rubra]